MAMPWLVAVSPALVSLLFTPGALAFCNCDAARQCSAMATANRVVMGQIGDGASTHDGIDYSFRISKSFIGGLPEGVGITISTKTEDCGTVMLPTGQEYLLSLIDAGGGFQLSGCGYNRAWSLVPSEDRAAFESGRMPSCEGSGGGDEQPEPKAEHIAGHGEGISDSYEQGIPERIDEVVPEGIHDVIHEIVSEEVSEGIPEEHSEEQPSVSHQQDVLEEFKRQEEKTKTTTTTEIKATKYFETTHARLESTKRVPEKTHTTEVAETTDHVSTTDHGDKETAVPQPGFTGCVNGPFLVEDGWTGSGAAAENECNVCFCVKGILACTKRVCRQQNS